MIPLILFMSYRAGAIWMGNEATFLPFSSNITLEQVKQNITQYLWGSITLAVIAGIFGGLLTWLLIKFSKRKTAIAV
jgi:membrane protein YqaA with SNARE-associated domain